MRRASPGSSRRQRLKREDAFPSPVQGFEKAPDMVEHSGTFSNPVGPSLTFEIFYTFTPDDPLSADAAIHEAAKKGGTLADVAERSGVSVSTVKRVLILERIDRRAREILQGTTLPRTALRRLASLLPSSQLKEARRLLQ